MPKHALKNLKNLGAHASGVTQRTRLSVAYQAKELKENVAPPPMIHTTPTQSSPSFNADLLLQAASILDGMSTTSQFEQPPPTQAAPNDIIFLTTADEDFEDLGSADGAKGAEEPLHWLDDEDDNAGEEDDELFRPSTENPLVMDESLETGAHQGNNSEPSMEIQHTLLVSNGAFAWELRKPPSIESTGKALHDLKVMLKPC
ncbi:hypothetical protein BU15DRAFT_67103 [Melanogaster broomeanus]|nr:hypothetical protein BU15DRAFT_67103 [Melanogaster broomeanus]